MALVCPCVKFPVCVFVIFSAGVGGGMTVTMSLPVPPADPPPDTLTVFVTDEGAFVATVTVTVIVG